MIAMCLASIFLQNPRKSTDFCFRICRNTDWNLHGQPAGPPHLNEGHYVHGRTRRNDGGNDGGTVRQCGGGGGGGRACWAVLACKQQLGWKQSSGTFFGEPTFFVYKFFIIVHNLYWLAGVTQLDDALICVFFYSRDQYTNYTSSDSNYMYKVVEYSLT